MSAWLVVIGIGEEGWSALSGAMQALIESAALVVGGERHLALIPKGRYETLAWKSPLADTLPAIARRRGQRVVVLASGDPFCYGVGAVLARRFTRDEMIVLPAPSAFSLVAARLLWPLEDCVCLSFHARPLERLRLHLAPAARIIALSNDGRTPGKVAQLLRESGWGDSQLMVFEHLGGPREHRIEAIAAEWHTERVADLNTIALHCVVGPGAKPLSRCAGLPDDAFHHDGQITKHAVRAATLAALAPLPGELLWDIGAGCGSVTIEWLRAARGMEAIAIERDKARAALIADNAAQLGVPDIEIVCGDAPGTLVGLPAPDAIFIGGGVSNAAIWDAVWQSLRPGGRIVANAVSLAGEAALFLRHETLGGELSRIAVAQAENHRFWRQSMQVTQLVVAKPR